MNTKLSPGNGSMVRIFHFDYLPPVREDDVSTDPELKQILSDIRFGVTMISLQLLVIVLKLIFGGPQ